jgi:hypothetical protein
LSFEISFFLFVRQQYSTMADEALCSQQCIPTPANRHDSGHRTEPVRYGKAIFRPFTGVLLGKQKSAAGIRFSPGTRRENPTPAHESGPPVNAGYIRFDLPAHFIRQDNPVPHHRTEQDHLDEDHGSQALRCMQRVAERHDLYRQWNREFVEHCD